MSSLGVIVGSLREQSFNLRLAYALDKLNHRDVKFNILKIDDIPLYNQDLDENLPEPVKRLKQDITESDAILFVTPEYNRSIPGVLKNIIDWGTRPYGKNVWSKKLIAGIGTSPGAIGTAVAQSHLRSIMVAIDAIYVGFPEVYLVYKEGMIDDKFNFTDESTKQFLQRFMDQFVNEIENKK